MSDYKKITTIDLDELPKPPKPMSKEDYLKHQKRNPFVWPIPVYESMYEAMEAEQVKEDNIRGYRTSRVFCVIS
jgi:hypothetical protein